MLAIDYATLEIPSEILEAIKSLNTTPSKLTLKMLTDALDRPVDTLSLRAYIKAYKEQEKLKRYQTPLSDLLFSVEDLINALDTVDCEISDIRLGSEILAVKAMWVDYLASVQPKEEDEATNSKSTKKEEVEA